MSVRAGKVARRVGIFSVIFVTPAVKLSGRSRGSGRAAPENALGSDRPERLGVGGEPPARVL